MDIKSILLSERYRGSHVVQFFLHGIFRIGKSTETEERLVVVMKWREGGMGSDCLRGLVCSFGEIKMF